MLAIIDSIMRSLVTTMTWIVGIAATAIIVGWLIGLVRRSFSKQG